MRAYIFDLLSAACFTCLIQNLIFTGGFGATEAIRMAAKPNNLLRSTGFVTFFSVSVTLISRALDLNAGIKALGTVEHAVIFAAVLSGVYIISFTAARLLHAGAQTLRRMGVCALNTLVLSLPYIAYKSAFTLAQALGAALGASLAYVLATILIHLGLERLRENDSIPPAFKGNGALFIYTAILSLAFAGLSGKAISL